MGGSMNFNIGHIITIVIAVIGWIYSYGRLVQRINNIQNKIKCSDDCIDRFVERSQFNEYKTVVCKKLDDLNKTIKEFDNKNSRVHQELMLAFNKNTEMMGEIKGFLEFYKGQRND